MSDAEQRVLRIDISSKNPLYGKTTVAAVLARALQATFPTTEVIVQCMDGDYVHRHAELLRHQQPQINADRIEIIDMNQNPPVIDPGVRSTWYHLPESVEDVQARLEDPANYPEQPLALVTLVGQIIRDVAGESGIDQAAAQTLTDLIWADPRFLQAAQEFECDRGDQYHYLQDVVAHQNAQTEVESPDHSVKPGKSQEPLKWADGREQPMYGDPETVSVLCLYSNLPDIGAPAPIDLKAAVLNMKLGGFNIMYDAIKSKIRETTTSPIGEEEVDAKCLFELLLWVQWALQSALALQQGRDGLAEVGLITAGFTHGPLDDKIFNTRSDEWPDPDTMARTVEQANPIQGFALDPQFQKPRILSS